MGKQTIKLLTLEALAKQHGFKPISFDTLHEIFLDSQAVALEDEEGKILVFKTPEDVAKFFGVKVRYAHRPFKAHRALIRTDFIGNDEKFRARDRAVFYIEVGRNETSTLEAYRLDTTTKKQLKHLEKWSSKVLGKQLDKSDIVRLAIHNLWKEWHVKAHEQ